MNKTSMLYYVAGVLALIAAVVMFADGLLPDERLRAGLYVVAGVLLLWVGYRRGLKSP